MRELTEQEKAHAQTLEPAAREALARHKAEEDRMKILRDDREEDYVVTELATRLKEAQEENTRLREQLEAAQTKCTVYQQSLQRANDALDLEGIELDQNDFLEAMRKVREGKRQAARQAEGEWVSVEERLPEDGRLVLIAYQNVLGDVLSQSKPDVALCFKRRWRRVTNLQYKVTHWRNLPPLPGPEEEGA